MKGRLRRWMLLVRIDVRQPAAWLALVLAVVTAGLVPGTPAAGSPGPALMATLLGGMLAVMAVGDAGDFRAAAGIDVGWLAERIAWPLAGWAAVAASRHDWPLLGCGAVGILATATLVAALVRQGAVGADAASAALLAAGGSGAAGWTAESVWPGRFPAGAAAVVLLGLVVFGTGVMVRPTPALRFHLRRALTATGMFGALGGMVAWLLLAADRAVLDLMVSLAGFVALAIPAATLGDGVSHAALWRRVERAAAAAEGGRLHLPPGRHRDGVFAVLTTAAVLGWPPLVAAVIAGPARSWPAAQVVLALMGTGGAALAVVWLGERASLRPATVQATALGWACLAVVGTPAVMVPRPAAPPIIRGFAGEAARTGVEETMHSCHTCRSPRFPHGSRQGCRDRDPDPRPVPQPSPRQGGGRSIPFQFPHGEV